MVLRATPVARAVAAMPPGPALCASAATYNRRARSSSDGRTASNRSAMGFSSIIPPLYRDHAAARIAQPLKAPADALISGHRLSFWMSDAFIPTIGAGVAFVGALSLLIYVRRHTYKESRR